MSNMRIPKSFGNQCTISNKPICNVIMFFSDTDEWEQNNAKVGEMSNMKKGTKNKGYDKWETNTNFGTHINACKKI